MKGWKKGMAALLAAALTVGTAAGCAASMSEYGTTPALVYGDQTIYLDEANFWLRYQQWLMESQYGLMYQYYGYTNMWEASADSYTTMGQQLKEDVMAQLIQTCILNDHAEEKGVSLTEEDEARITETVAEFREDFDDSFREYSDASDESIAAWLRENALAVKVWDAVKQEAEVTVTDEESQMFTIEYVNVTAPEEETGSETAAESTTAAETTAAEGETAAAADDSEEALEGEALANEVLSRLQEGQAFSDFEDELGVTTNTQSFLRSDTDNASTIYQEGVGLSTGESKIVSYDSGWYVIYCAADLDQEATEEKRADVEDERREEHFEAVYAEWAAAAPAYEVQDAWDDLKIDEMIYVEKTTEAAESTEADTTAAESTEAETSGEDTTAADTTEAGTTETDTTAAESSEAE